jgi:tetratricopeptide (TPR) repeat protein
MTLQFLKIYDEAIISYHKAIELDPNNEFYYRHNGSCYYELNRFDEAIYF